MLRAISGPLYLHEGINQFTNLWTLISKVGVGSEDVEVGFSAVASGDRVFVHEDFDPSIMENDLALIRLSETLDLDGPRVSPVCLPRNSTEMFAGKEAVVTGWGTTEYGEITFVLGFIIAKSSSNCRLFTCTEQGWMLMLVVVVVEKLYIVHTSATDYGRILI